LKKLLNLEDPFFAPLWIRTTIVVLLGFWTMIEFFAGAQGWAAFFAALAVFSAWRFAVIDYTREGGEE
jgi:hypothetical protein